jgi:hypothetical protein
MEEVNRRGSASRAGDDVDRRGSGGRTGSTHGLSSNPMTNQAAYPTRAPPGNPFTAPSGSGPPAYAQDYKEPARANSVSKPTRAPPPIPRRPSRRNMVVALYDFTVSFLLVS